MHSYVVTSIDLGKTALVKYIVLLILTVSYKPIKFDSILILFIILILLSCIIQMIYLQCSSLALINNIYILYNILQHCKNVI